MQEKTDNDDMSKAVKLNFIREMTLFSPVCTLMPLGLAARIWCHLPDLSHTETTKADYSEWNCSVEILVRFPVPKGSGEGRPIPGIFLAWQFVAKMFIKSGERWYRQHVNSQQSELGNLIRKYRLSNIRKDSDLSVQYLFIASCLQVLEKFGCVWRGVKRLQVQGWNIQMQLKQLPL